MRNSLNLIVILCIFFVCRTVPLQAKSEARKVHTSESKIIDGDTFQASTKNSYRLAGIDAPEHDQPFGKESSERLKELLDSGDLVGLWCLPKADKYGRDVCQVVLNVNGTKVDPAEELLKEGLAEVEYARFLTPSSEMVYRIAQAEAKKAKLGIWNLKDRVTPWEWRHRSAQ